MNQGGFMQKVYDYKCVKSLNIDMNIYFVLRGLQLKLVTKKFAEDFAVDLIEHYDQVDNHINELAWGVKSEIDAVDLLLKTISDSDLLRKYESLPDLSSSDQFDKEIWKWRYVMLKDAVTNYKSKHELFESIDIIYSHFGFHEDMYDLIYYHPTKEKMMGTPEDAQKKLESTIHDFVEKQSNLFVSKA
jgi:hypothetical protein